MHTVYLQCFVACRRRIIGHTKLPCYVLRRVWLVANKLAWLVLSAAYDTDTCFAGMHAALQHMTKTLALQESMRLFPVVGSGTTRRNLEKDMWIGGGQLFVPKGVLVWIPMHAVQNVTANWDEPDQFQPERWSQVSPPLATFMHSPLTRPVTRQMRISVRCIGVS